MSYRHCHRLHGGVCSTYLKASGPYYPLVLPSILLESLFSATVFDDGVDQLNHLADYPEKQSSSHGHHIRTPRSGCDLAARGGSENGSNVCLFHSPSVEAQVSQARIENTHNAEDAVRKDHQNTADEEVEAEQGRPALKFLKYSLFEYGQNPPDQGHQV